MKNKKTPLLSILAIIILVGVIILAIKILNGAINIVGGLFDSLLAIIIIIAMIVLVIWMFSYAKKHKK